MEIKSKNGKTIYVDDNADDMKDLIVAAAKSGADLRGAELRGAGLRGAELSGADLSGAYLRDADLRDADLRGADLIGADISGADLSGAYLRGADLSGAGLSGAYLSGADLRGANLRDADLRHADLRGADISGAYLRSADLSGADLISAYLSGAYLIGAKNIPFIPYACPSDGDFTGWKKVGGKLIELRIPEDAKRSSATTDKCRCDKALVMSIFDIETKEQYAEITNYNYEETTYRVGEMVYPDSFDDDRWNECSHGINFFINKESAINY